MQNDLLATLKPQLCPFAELTDAEVVIRVLHGDKPKFERLMRRYNRQLSREPWTSMPLAASALNMVNTACNPVAAALWDLD